MVHLSAVPGITEGVTVMIDEETRRKLRELKMDAFVDALDSQEASINNYVSMDFDQRLTIAVDEFYATKNRESAKRLNHLAKFRYPEADLMTLYYEGRPINKNEIVALGTCGYINTATNLVINGYTGSGKTHLSCALGKEACRRLHRTKYIRMPDLLELLNTAMELNHSISSTVTKLSNYHLLIIDEWLVDIPSEREVRFLLEIFEKRYDQWPTIFDTQYKTSEWHARLGGGVIADAILDRIVHNCKTINLGSANMRALFAGRVTT